MRTCANGLLLALCLLSLSVRADEAEDRLTAQKKAAATAWQAVEAGPSATRETKHLLLWAPKAMEGRLEAVGALLERYHDHASKTLALDPMKELSGGKVTVYLFLDKDLLATFARRVEGRRPVAGDTGSFSAADDKLLVVAVPAAGKVPVPVETGAGEQLAALLLARKAGRGTSLPDWLLAGFGRATTYRVSPRDRVTAADLKQTRALAHTRKPSDVWSGGANADEAEALQGSVADFLAHGPASRTFDKFLDGFKPVEGREKSTVGDALTTAGLTEEKLEKAWKTWAAK